MAGSTFMPMGICLNLLRFGFVECLSIYGGDISPFLRVYANMLSVAIKIRYELCRKSEGGRTGVLWPRMWRGRGCGGAEDVTRLRTVFWSCCLLYWYWLKWETAVEGYCARTRTCWGFLQQSFTAVGLYTSEYSAGNLLKSATVQFRRLFKNN